MRKFFVALALAGAFSGLIQAQATTPKCSNCAVWNAPQKPFKIYGNTYYVGPHGLSSVLITSDGGHVLIDGALDQSAQSIAANIKALGFRIEDVKLIVNSHVHYDHAGGIAELQRLSGARVAALPWSAAVLKNGGSAKDDPQYGILLPLARVAKVEVVKPGQPIRIGAIEITPHSTPGHTPGGTSWTWTSCEQGKCVPMVYADSVTAVSAPNFKFSASKTAAADFAKSFEFLRTTPCDVLITAHPELSDVWKRLAERDRLGTSEPMIDPQACKNLADKAESALKERLASEK